MIRRVAAALAALLAAGCVTARLEVGTSAQLAVAAARIPAAQAGDVTVVAAGDVADCANLAAARATAALVELFPSATVLVPGDTAYPDGATNDFARCYGPTWGAFKSRTRPAPGNHEYHTPDAAGYFAYFGAAAGNPGQGYYSYDIGAWHLIALNANCKFVACKAGSAQEVWLKSDLQSHANQCTLAYWHQPRFSSGSGGGTSSVGAFWNDLYANHAEIVLNGHLHTYERFAPLNPSGAVDNTNGIREFIVGTGGDNHGKFKTIHAGSQVRNTTTYGVLELTLGADSYSWSFVPVTGGTFTDSGTTDCH